MYFQLYAQITSKRKLIYCFHGNLFRYVRLHHHKKVSSVNGNRIIHISVQHNKGVETIMVTI
jgi:hypothetical protein